MRPAGPASSVPEIWGLREFDAFLLMVDGVPWGGAFNPALATLDFNNIERIEILRGPAPVMYGATSFVGVIHVLHLAAGEGPRIASAYGGSHSFVGASVYLPLTSSGDYRQSLAANYDTKGSSATFQLRPKSSRLILPVAWKPARRAPFMPV